MAVAFVLVFAFLFFFVLGGVGYYHSNCACS